MKLALRKNPDSQPWNHKAAATVIRLRLVTEYPHAGIVIADTLYHATASGGVHAVPFIGGENWRLIEAGGDDAAALDRFAQHDGAGYDFVSLLAFAMVTASDSRRWYCYEWCYFMMTGLKPGHRITPETLMDLVLGGGV